MCRFLLVCLAILALAACASAPTLGAVTLTRAALDTTDATDSVTLSYTIGQPAKVSIAIADTSGARYVLRQDEPRNPSADPYTLRFDGSVPTTDPVLVRRQLPSGEYTVSVAATGADGQQSSQQLPLSVRSADTPPPLIENLVTFPAAISPNSDGVEDVSEITYSLPTTATVDMSIVAQDGATYPFVTNFRAEPGPQRHVWTGRTVDGATLPDGPYRLNMAARDRFGNLVEQHADLTISGGGVPEATITDVRIAPQALLLGETLTVTLRIKNTGKVPIRTYGPASGYTYTTKQVFSSIEQGQYDAKSGGFWRVGMDWDANSGGGPKRYPFRWAISPRPPEQWQVPNVEDVLLPGEEAVVVGRVVVEQQETKMGFYVGLIQDGVGFRQDKLGRTIVKVGF